MYDLLFSDGKIGTLAIPNRVIMGSLHLGFENLADSEERLARFYEERAKGRAGLMVTGGSAVSAEGASDLQFTHIWNPQEEKKFRKITERVHLAGGRIALQLFHAGRYARGDITGLQPVAPSTVPTRMSPTLARELKDEEVWKLVEAFASGAAKAKDYGFDGVELMGSEGYLLNQFVSPVTNRRTDQWGGSAEKRMQFPLEVVKAIRQKVGSEFPVIYRMSGIDLIPNSTTPKEITLFAQLLEQTGVDALNVGIGWHESEVPTVQEFVPHGAYIHFASEIKQVVNIPVIGSNRINTLEDANRVIAEGAVDFVSMARPFLADPYIALKGEEKEPESINVCIGCNQSCLDKTFSQMPSSCMVNPLAGRESFFSLVPCESPRKVAVVGGGPGGLEAARVLAERGHQVTLFEKENVLGGQFRWAAKVPGKEDFAHTIRYFTYELTKMQVDVQLNSVPHSEQLASYDAVVLATGVKPRQIDISGKNLPHVNFYTDYFEDRIVVGDKVAIIGAGGIAVDVAHRLTKGMISPEIAVFMVNYGLESKESVWDKLRPSREVTIMRRGNRVAEGIGKTTRWVSLQELKIRHVNILTDVEYNDIVEDGVWIRKEGKARLISADTIIIAAGQESERAFLNELKKVGFQEAYVPPVEPFYHGKGKELIEEYKQRFLSSKKQVFVIGGAKEAKELDAERAILEGTLVGRLI